VKEEWQRRKRRNVKKFFWPTYDFFPSPSFPSLKILSNFTFLYQQPKPKN
jgi:hypothetical protein